MLANRLHAPRKVLSVIAKRQVTVIPATGKNPPSLDEFDPLNPGEWQLGVSVTSFLLFIIHYLLSIGSMHKYPSFEKLQFRVLSY